ncbi:MAG: Solanesyl diphosphate synthase, partial [uncultured Acidimicrobiales bacterium]
ERRRALGPSRSRRGPRPGRRRPACCCGHRGRLPRRGRGPPDPGRRQALPARSGPGRRRGVRLGGHRGGRPGRSRVRADAPRVAVPRRRDGRCRHPPRRALGQRQVGQPGGDRGRRLPPREGVGDRHRPGGRGVKGAGPHPGAHVRGPGPRAADGLFGATHRGPVPAVDRREDRCPDVSRLPHRRPGLRGDCRAGGRSDGFRRRLRLGIPGVRRHRRPGAHGGAAGQAGGPRPGGGRLHPGRAARPGRRRRGTRAARPAGRPNRQRRPRQGPEPGPLHRRCRRGGRLRPSAGRPGGGVPRDASRGAGARGAGHPRPPPPRRGRV